MKVAIAIAFVLALGTMIHHGVDWMSLFFGLGCGILICRALLWVDDKSAEFRCKIDRFERRFGPKKHVHHVPPYPIPPRAEPK